VNGRLIATVLIAVVVMIAGAILFPVQLPHVQLPAEPIGHLGSFTITNTILSGWVASLIVLFLLWRGTASSQMIPTGFQNFVEIVCEFVLGLCESIAGPRRGREFFPLVATIFLFVITANWMGLLPGVGSIGFWETPHAVESAAAADTHGEAVKPGEKPAAKEAVKEAAEKPGDHGPVAEAGTHEGPVLVPLFRAATSDLNTTLAIALISVVATQVVGLRHLGGEYVGRFFNFSGGPIGFYVGILELIAEFAKIVSFTFRLFGNVFAGEVLLGVITFLLPWIVVLPFMGLELFVGFIQAFVFAILTLVFMSLATESHAGHGEEHGGAARH
jgi:F-type H+-transporting ATPase subunit a